MTHLWHPFADMNQVSTDGEFFIDRGQGYYVYDESGRRYLDATASLWYCNVGHGRRELAEAAAHQIDRLEAYSVFGDFANRPASDLAERLADLAPARDSVSFFTSGGSDSIDTAVKLARKYWQVRGEVDRHLVISRELSYHGMHLGGTSLAGIEANRVGYGPLLEDSAPVAWDSAQALAEAIDKAGGPEHVAAFFCEPVIAAGGVFPPPPGYLEEVQKVCRDSGVLFVADEVVTAFGRVGDWFASSRFQLQPDMVVCAKGITSGYLPMGAVIVSPWVAEPFFKGGMGMWRHGYTYSGHATVAAVALANLRILEEEDLIGAGRRLEEELRDSLLPLAAHELVREVRAGTGVLAAVQIDEGLIETDPLLPARVVKAARRTGILTRALATGAIHISPPLIIDAAGMKELTEGLAAALDEAA